MIKTLLYAVFFLAGAPGFSDPLHDLIIAEQNFASVSVAKGAKTAFLENLDQKAIVFSGGKPVKGYELWKNRPDPAITLQWWPQLAEVSKAGDLGYTTGPFTLSTKSKPDSILTRGQYSTIWKKDNQGNWKAIVDIGIQNSQLAQVSKITEIRWRKLHYVQHTLSDVRNLEAAFLKAYQEDQKTAYSKFLSATSVVNRMHMLPAIDKKPAGLEISMGQNLLSFTLEGVGMSTSGDLAYTYGNLHTNGGDQNFVRVWRYESGGWKIALDVLS